MKKGILILATITIATLVGLANLKATTLNNWISSSTYRIGDQGSWQNMTNDQGNYWTFNHNTSSNVRYFMQFNNQRNIPQNGIAKFNIMFKLIDQIETSDITLNNPQITCTFNHTYDNPWGYIWDNNLDPTGRYEDIELIYNNFNCSSNQTTGSIDHELLQYNLSLAYYHSGSTEQRAPCYPVAQSGTNYQFECPLTTSTMDGLILSINTNQYIEYTIGYYWSFTTISDGTTDIINNQNQNTQEIINQNATYSDDPKEEVEGKNETADYEQKEQQLMGSLDFNMTAMDNISINPNASTFIWQIADKLRSINPAIILLMTSILGMGLIKLILNR